jgi:hypothetical protein
MRTNNNICPIEKLYIHTATYKTPIMVACLPFFNHHCCSVFALYL